MGNCFAQESSARSISKGRSRGRSRPPSSPRAASPVNVDATPEKKQPLSPPSQASQTPNYVTDRNKVKKKVRFADDVVCSGQKKEEVMKVKMVMRKKDAALLLAMLGSAVDNQSAMDCMLSKMEVVQGAGCRKRDMDSKSNQLIAMDTK